MSVQWRYGARADGHHIREVMLMADPAMLFDLTLKDADLHAALDDFFHQAGCAYLYDDDPTGVVTVHAADVGFRDALKLMLPDGYEAMEIDGIYHIRRLPPSQRQQAA